MSAPAASAPRGRSVDSEAVRAALARPDLYPERPRRVQVRETHISWVYLAGERAYKLKKPLTLPFLDYSTPRRRREACRAEVRLNRRLAPAVYLGVRSLAATPEGLVLAAEDDPRAVEYVVEMRRYDERRTLAATLARGELGPAEVEAVARVLARFHARAPRATDHAHPRAADDVRAPRAADDARAPRAADPAPAARIADSARARLVADSARARRAAATTRTRALERHVTEECQELLALLEQRAEVERVLALERFAHAFLAAHTRALDARARGGLVREVHGDLRAEHVLLGDGPPEVVDCVEFDRRLRELDVADDLAFLAMDLTAHGGEYHAHALVRAYRAAGGDPGPEWLLAFYAALRALVRAKVELVRAAQLPRRGAAHGHHSAVARDLLALAERLAWRARGPLVLVVCGPPAAGKSHLAQALAAASGLAHLSSDVTRKQLAGLDPASRAPAECYTAQWNARTYEELGRRAALQAGAHGGAVVDATCRHRADRDALARGLGGVAPAVFVECRAPAAVLAARAAARERAAARVSDASLPVVVRESVVWEPLEETPAAAHVTVRSDRPVEAVVADLVALLDLRLGA